MENSKISYKPFYTGIFSGYYFVEGLNVSILSVIIPIYLLTVLPGGVDAEKIGNLASIVTMPWAIKFIFGILGDKIGLKSLGRRKPWIIIPGMAAGLVWSITPLLINGVTDENQLFSIFRIVGLIGSFGFAMGDTSIDGLVLDICPKEQLGRVQGFCWGSRSVGSIAGGSILALLILALNASTQAIFVVFGITTIIFSFLTLMIKEPAMPQKIELGEQLKSMFTGKENWTIYFWSIIHTLTEGVFFLYLSLFILIELNLIEPINATLNSLRDSTEMYQAQAYVNILTGLGIIVGALIGGYIADKVSRKKSAYLAYLISIASCFLLLIHAGPIYTMSIAVFCGMGLGWRNSSYTAILGEYSKKYPKMDSTYFSLGSSFCNIGLSAGLAIVAQLFAYFGTNSGNYINVYDYIWISIGFMLILAPISFALLKYKDTIKEKQ